MESPKNKHSNGTSHDDGGHHIVPFKVYYWIWLALIIGTIVTVATSYVDFGELNLVIAMLIATAKALLVMLFFMGLRYEGYENNVTFFMSFLFLAIFFSLTGSDLFFRKDQGPMVVDPSNIVQSTEKIDFNAVSKPSSEMLSKGKTIYAQQCATCHGDSGKGDGAAAAALNPKPRNFTSAEGWKFPKTLSGVFNTITNGSPGTPMPGFSGISVSDRFALSHYVRKFLPSAPEDSASELAELDKKVNVPVKQKLPIATAIDKIATVPSPGLRTAGFSNQNPSDDSASLDDEHRHLTRASSGEKLYKQSCASCHGLDGRGGIAINSRGVNPELKIITQAFSKSMPSDRAEFIRRLSTSSGQNHHGFATLSSTQWDALFTYVKGLSH